jgi:hypothetical protein
VSATNVADSGPKEGMVRRLHLPEPPPRES